MDLFVTGVHPDLYPFRLVLARDPVRSRPARIAPLRRHESSGVGVR
ncbi:MAG TPA: hypothetical protein VII06_34225 [Chloroflexota bacterium]